MVVSLAGFSVLIFDLYTCGVWVDSVDPVAKILYQTTSSEIIFLLESFPKYRKLN